MIKIVPFWKIFCLGQKNFQQGFAKFKYRWLQSSRLKMSRYLLFGVYSGSDSFSGHSGGSGSLKKTDPYDVDDYDDPDDFAEEWAEEFGDDDYDDGYDDAYDYWEEEYDV